MNLLPQKEIKKLRKETIMRFIIIVCSLVSFIEVISIFIIAPSYIFVKTERNNLFESVAQIKQTILGKGSVDEELKIIGKDINLFIENESSEEFKISDLIRIVLDIKPKGISINSISITKDEKGGVIQITGIGDTRESLIEFQRIFESKEFVKEAKYTEKFIMKKSNINYNLIVSLK